ncbi:MAG: M24 family metallopeptidase [Phenylobacterium sp.]|uniref:M24 family metallopeptidase n=1 Tax=Phenylobacterium sp. TaxID=1871053 RepID=UPI0025FC5742|nr:M24 family metallopeptidase [Phenylobacterium sp.]MBI1199001.1 M24 family metallopeptidase [Phenylobacterium sp.]
MSNLETLQAHLAASGCDAVLVPSSDEYLSEYSPPHDRRLAWATGFTGSTGAVAVTPTRAALFVDGRYTEQAARQVDLERVDVRPLTDAARLEWLRANLPPGARIAIDPRLHSDLELRGLLQGLARAGFATVLDPRNLVDEVWRADRPAASRSTIFQYDVAYAGRTREAKLEELRVRMADLGQDLTLVSDPEDVAWLLNVRTRDSVDAQPARRHVVPIPRSRALVPRQGPVLWFTEPERFEEGLADKLAGVVDVRRPDAFAAALRDAAAGRRVAANLRKTSHRDAALVREAGELVDDTAVARSRWIKTPREIAVAREGHLVDGAAVIRFLAWLVAEVAAGRPVSELEADERVTVLREQDPRYLGLSMSNHSASGPSGALPHYVATQASNRLINDHPIFWMDTGGQYLGCSTDNTVCFAMGAPDARHVEAHTLVVKGWMAMARATFPDGIHSTQIDTFARQFLWSRGMDFGHGTGHGVGNLMNIHEGPYIRKEIHHPLVAPMAEGMIVSNEPGYYAPGDFGVRVESHLLTIRSRHPGFLEFETISKLPIDPALIGEGLLEADEAAWLAAYHRDLVAAYAPRLEATPLAWLQGLADAFAAMASRRAAR